MSPLPQLYSEAGQLVDKIACYLEPLPVRAAERQLAVQTIFDRRPAGYPSEERIRLGRTFSKRGKAGGGITSPAYLNSVKQRSVNEVYSPLARLVLAEWTRLHKPLHARIYNISKIRPFELLKLSGSVPGNSRQNIISFRVRSVGIETFCNILVNKPYHFSSSLGCFGMSCSNVHDKKHNVNSACWNASRPSNSFGFGPLFQPFQPKDSIYCYWGTVPSTTAPQGKLARISGTVGTGRKTADFCALQPFQRRRAVPTTPTKHKEAR